MNYKIDKDTLLFLNSEIFPLVEDNYFFKAHKRKVNIFNDTKKRKEVILSKCKYTLIDLKMKDIGVTFNNDQLFSKYNDKLKIISLNRNSINEKSIFETVLMSGLIKSIKAKGNDWNIYLINYLLIEISFVFKVDLKLTKKIAKKYFKKYFKK
jgi:hypothetical protein